MHCGAAARRQSPVGGLSEKQHVRWAAARLWLADRRQPGNVLPYGANTLHKHVCTNTFQTRTGTKRLGDHGRRAHLGRCTPARGRQRAPMGNRGGPRGIRPRCPQRPSPQHGVSPAADPGSSRRRRAHRRMLGPRQRPNPGSVGVPPEAAEPAGARHRRRRAEPCGIRPLDRRKLRRHPASCGSGRTHTRVRNGLGTRRGLDRLLQPVAARAPRRHSGRHGSRLPVRMGARKRAGIRRARRVLPRPARMPRACLPSVVFPAAKRQLGRCPDRCGALPPLVVPPPHQPPVRMHAALDRRRRPQRAESGMGRRRHPCAVSRPLCPHRRMGGPCDRRCGGSTSFSALQS